MSSLKIPPLFVNRDMVVRQTYDRLVTLLERFGDITYEPVKETITFSGAGPFMGAMPMQSVLRLSILATQPIDNPRIRKCTRVKAGRFYNQIDVANQWELDDELLAWIKEAYHLAEADAAAG